MLESKKVVVFGNSGSGKSTLATHLCDNEDLAHLDLDTIAWKSSPVPTRCPIDQSAAKIQAFTAANPRWVIEGCYADLLALAIDHSTEIIYMNLPMDLCVENARNRAWEPHKYESKAAQDANLSMLEDWIRDYNQREDVFSARAHQALYDEYSGKKAEHSENLLLQ